MIELQPFTTERTWTRDGVPILTLSMELPQPVNASDRTARRLRHYYRLQSRSYLRYCEKWLLPQAETEYRTARSFSTPPLCFHAELTYHITYHSHHFLSLYTQSREQTLPTQTLLTRRGDTWNLATGYPVPPGAFFPPRSNWKRRLLTAAAEEIQQQERSGISRYLDNWPRQLRRSFNPQNYFLTEDGWAFFFPMYAIAPAMEGIPTFTLPYGSDGPFSPEENPPVFSTL